MGLGYTKILNPPGGPTQPFKVGVTLTAVINVVKPAFDVGKLGKKGGEGGDEPVLGNG